MNEINLNYFTRRITRQAGEALLGYSREIVGEKEGSGNLVLEADLQSERLLVSRIKSRFPTHQILSEGTESKLEKPEEIENLWIIDPLDGTTNFSFGFPNFAVSVAYVEKGSVKSAAIFDPMRKELFWADEGQGAFLNGTRINIGRSENLSRTLIHTGSPYSRENFLETSQIMNKLHGKGARIVILGSSVLGLSYVAAGRVSLFFETGLKPWDIAAASLLIKEAGGEVRDIDKELDLFNFRGVLAGNRILIQAFLETIWTKI